MHETCMVDNNTWLYLHSGYTKGHMQRNINRFPVCVCSSVYYVIFPKFILRSWMLIYDKSVLCLWERGKKNIKEQKIINSLTPFLHTFKIHTLTLFNFRTLVVLSSVRGNDFVLYLSHHVLRQMVNGKEEQPSQELMSALM